MDLFCLLLSLSFNVLQSASSLICVFGAFLTFGGNFTVEIDLCPLQGTFFSQFWAETFKRLGVYLQNKRSTFGELKLAKLKLQNVLFILHM